MDVVISFCLTNLTHTCTEHNGLGALFTSLPVVHESIQRPRAAAATTARAAASYTIRTAGKLLAV